LIAGYEAQLQGLNAARVSKESQRAVLAEQLVGLRNLAGEGYLPRNRLLEQERLYAQVDGAVSEDIGRIGQLQSQLLDARLRLSARSQEDQRQIGAELADAQVRADALGHALRAAQFTLDHANVKAPVAGTVMGLTIFTAGGTIEAGKPLMDIVPAGEPLEIEGQVPVHLIDQVHSADRFVDERTGVPYYRLLARVTDAGMTQLEGLNLRPGMPVDAFVNTGERSLLSYLFKPLADRAHLALSEE
jgi:protease secretion system membrane fusion protein